MKNIETKAIEAGDSEFLFEVYANSRMREVEAWGWGKDQIQQFLHMQYICQQHSYKIHYPNLQTSLIIFKKEKVGRLLVTEQDDKFVIVDITLLPNYQNKGIGSTILLELLEIAATSNKSVQLSVHRDNSRAIKLYERLGFRYVAESEIYIQMEWFGD